MSDRIPTRMLTLVLACLTAVVLVWDYQLFQMVNKSTDWNYYFNLAYGSIFLLATYIAFLGAKQLGASTKAGRVFLCFSASMAMWAIGLGIWTFYNVVPRVEVPYPGLSDIPFILFYPIMGYGLWRMDDLYHGQPGKHRLLASLPLILVSALVVFIVMRRPDLSSELPLLERLANLAYSLGNAFLLSMALVAWQSSLKRFQQGRIWLLMSLFVLTVADYLFTYRSAKEIYWNGDISDLLYAGVAILFCIGLLQITRKLQVEKRD